MSLSELQEITMRQHQQIEHNQQLLMAKEKRLKYLRQDELKRQHQSTSQQKNKIDEKQQHQQKNKKNIINNQFNQELKLLKLKILRNHIIEKRTANSYMYTQLDLIKLLFVDKERELHDAISKVSELTKQIDQLRKPLQTTTITTNNSQMQMNWKS